MSAHGPVEVAVTDHACLRWRERVRPGLTPEQAADELVALLEAGGYWIERPGWVEPGVLHGSRWLALDQVDGIALAVQHDGSIDVVVTVVTRSGDRPDRPQRRARRSRESRSLRRKRSRAGKGSGPRPRDWHDDE